MLSPEPENSAQHTASSWPSKLLRHSPVSTSQTLGEVSSEVVTTFVLSGENSATYTMSECPVSTWRSAPSIGFQRRAVRSSEVVAMRAPDGLKVAYFTAL